MSRVRGIGCLPFAHLVLNFRDPASPSPRGVLAYATPKRLPFRLKRLAVTEEQIDEWNLPTRPTNRSDSHARNFGSSVSVERMPLIHGGCAVSLSAPYASTCPRSATTS